MKVKTLQDVHIRAHHPRRVDPAKGIVFKGFVIEVARELEGERIDGNARWYQDLNGDFIWSGGTTKIEEIPHIDVVREAIAHDKLSASQKQLRIPEIWERTRGEGVKVAVIDSGIVREHPDFRGAITDGFNARSPGAHFHDLDGHGTHCAGVIGARGLGEVIGVAPACSLFPIKMINRQTSGFSVDAFEKAMFWAIERGVHVISISLGKEEDPGNAMLHVVEKAMQANIVVVAAIGNDGEDHAGMGLNLGDFPAVHPECISVGALADDLTLATYSSRFSGTTLCAPGNNVKSTWKDGGYSTQTCTSIATPFVAGVAALMRAKRPGASVDEIRNALVRTAALRRVGDFEYRVIQPVAAFDAV